MRKIVSNEFAKANINHMFDEFTEDKRVFIYVTPENKDKAKEILNIMGNLVKEVPSYTLYQILNWKVILKRWY